MENSENLLSKDEIAALTAGIESGSVEVDTGFNTEIRARKHDLTNEDSSLGVNVSSLDMINERFIRQFRLSLLEVLRTSPRINPNRVQLKKFGDYMKDLRPPLSVNVVRVLPLRAGEKLTVHAGARHMTLTDKEVVNLREYLNRGGFIIMDDFDSPSFNWFTREMQKQLDW